MCRTWGQIQAYPELYSIDVYDEGHVRSLRFSRDDYKPEEAQCAPWEWSWITVSDYSLKFS